jgi:hypothetical protein
MHDYNRTDVELAYWLKKYLIFRGTPHRTYHGRRRRLVAVDESSG